MNVHGECPRYAYQFFVNCLLGTTKTEDGFRTAFDCAYADMARHTKNVSDDFKKDENYKFVEIYLKKLNDDRYNLVEQDEKSSYDKWHEDVCNEMVQKNNVTLG